METRMVKVELLNKILNYLANRPYIEVADLIREILELSEKNKEVAPITKK